MLEVVCVNDVFSEDWLKYFSVNGIATPQLNSIYTIREVVQNTVGEKGLLLVEIVNPPTSRISPLTGMRGTGEQNWAISRFTTLLGEQVTKEAIAESIKTTIHGNS